MLTIENKSQILTIGKHIAHSPQIKTADIYGKKNDACHSFYRKMERNRERTK